MPKQPCWCGVGCDEARAWRVARTVQASSRLSPTASSTEAAALSSDPHPATPSRTVCPDSLSLVARPASVLGPRVLGRGTCLQHTPCYAAARVCLLINDSKEMFVAGAAKMWRESQARNTIYVGWGQLMKHYTVGLEARYFPGSHGRNGRVTADAKPLCRSSATVPWAISVTFQHLCAVVRLRLYQTTPVRSGWECERLAWCPHGREAAQAA